MDVTWDKAQDWELGWWKHVFYNTFNEEQKQLVYAEKMGLRREHSPYTDFYFNLRGMSILDIGSGPVSLLLKCSNYKNSVVLDPLMDEYPEWVKERYKSHGLETICKKGEQILKGDVGEFDEVWIYNVLQHTDDPMKVVSNARKLGKMVRVFEWLETGTNDGHPHQFTEEQLNEMFGGEGKVEELRGNGCFGKAYYGIFRGDRYEP